MHRRSPDRSPAFRFRLRATTSPISSPQHRDELPFNDQLPTPGSAAAHRPPGAAVADDHAETAEGERGVHVAPRRPSVRRGARRRSVRVHRRFRANPSRCWSSPICSVCRSPTTRTSSDALLSGTGTIGSSTGDAMEHSPLEYLYGKFTEYIADRRGNPRDDVLTGVASATFPDGSTPEVIDAVCVAANLFAAGQETTVRLLSAAVMMIAEDPELQARLRADRNLLPASSRRRCASRVRSAATSGCPRCRSTVGGVELPAGTTVMLINAALNRDPRKFPDPDVFDVDRVNARHPRRVRPRTAQLPGRPFGPCRGAGQPATPAGPDLRYLDRRRQARPRRTPGATATCRRSSCAA